VPKAVGVHKVHKVQVVLLARQVFKAHKAVEVFKVHRAQVVLLARRVFRVHKALLAHQA
jgi:hypothetical protein